MPAATVTNFCLSSAQHSAKEPDGLTPKCTCMFWQKFVSRLAYTQKHLYVLAEICIQIGVHQKHLYVLAEICIQIGVHQKALVRFGK